MKKILLVSNYDCCYNWDLMIITIKDDGIETQHIDKFNKKIYKEEKIDLMIKCYNGNIYILDETDIPDIKEMCKEPQHLIAF